MRVCIISSIRDDVPVYPNPVPIYPTRGEHCDHFLSLEKIHIFTITNSWLALIVYIMCIRNLYTVVIHKHISHNESCTLP